MRKILLAVVAAALLSGCTQADVTANEQKAKAILQAVNAGAATAASVIKEGIDAVCANTSVVAAGGSVAGFVIGQQTGPNSLQNQHNLNVALNTLSSVCAQASANPNDPAMKSLLRTAWTAYQSAKAAQKAT